MSTDKSTQAVYVTHFPKDNPWVKLLGVFRIVRAGHRLTNLIVVWSVFVLESAFTLFTAIAAWNNFGANWGDVDTLLFIDWSWDPLPILNALGRFIDSADLHAPHFDASRLNCADILCVENISTIPKTLDIRSDRFGVLFF